MDDVLDDDNPDPKSITYLTVIYEQTVHFGSILGQVKRRKHLHNVVAECYNAIGALLTCSSYVECKF